MLRDDRYLRDLRRERDVRRLERHGKRVAVGRDVGHLRPDAARIERRELLQQVESERDVACAERLPVAPLDVLAQRVDQRRWVRELVPGGEERRVRAIDRARDLQWLV